MPWWEPVIGLEIHAQLRTRSKLFCGCAARHGAPPNSLTCPVCLGFPGALPVLNAGAVELALKAALALDCTIHPVSVFVRKNYFYPDLPKGYQITQLDQPLATGGSLEWTASGRAERVRLLRIHLEEDAGRSMHDRDGGPEGATTLDFNRSGVPLLEIVTEPEIHSAETAAAFFRRLRTLLVAIGVNDGNMEEGSLRCDANVSVREAGTPALGTRTEVKNLNSFRFLQSALEYEIERQVRILEEGRSVAPETRRWDVDSGATVTIRAKEEAEDYRYFPEPDLPPLVVTPERTAAVRATLPELPETRKARYRREFELLEADAAFLAGSTALSSYFEQVVALTGNPRLAANWILRDLAGKLRETGGTMEQAPVAPEALADLIRMVEGGAINRPTAKAVFEEMCASGKVASSVVASRGLGQISDESTLEAAVREVVAEHADAAADYRAGRQKAFGFLVGQVMKATGGRGNPRMVNELLKRALDCD
ncbi:MAG: Asp-tRNA(Asn)/Glu-tRNA(Gln) amidotransferase subunit GatB [Vicinamibacterales bacterium]